MAGSRKRQHESASALLEIKEQTESSKKMHTTEGNEEMFFRLFKYPKAGEQYILEIHQVETGSIDRHRLQVYKENRRWRLRVLDLEQGYHVVFPILQDPTPLIFQKKYDLSLQERLEGWKMETRKCGNGKENKVYCHGSRRFRSFVEMTLFVVYSSNPRDLKFISSNESSHETIGKETIEAVMIISSPQEPWNSPDDISKETLDPDKSIECFNQEESNVAKGQGTEADEIENEFLHYIYEVFGDETPPTMSELLGEPKPCKFLL